MIFEFVMFNGYDVNLSQDCCRSKSTILAAFRDGVPDDARARGAHL